MKTRKSWIMNPSIMFTWQVSKAKKVSKIILKVDRDNFDGISKKSYSLWLGGYQPEDAINRKGRDRI